MSFIPPRYASLILISMVNGTLPSEIWSAQNDFTCEHCLGDRSFLSVQNWTQHSATFVVASIPVTLVFFAVYVRIENISSNGTIKYRVCDICVGEWGLTAHCLVE